MISSSNDEHGNDEQPPLGRDERQRRAKAMAASLVEARMSGTYDDALLVKEVVDALGTRSRPSSSSKKKKKKKKKKLKSNKKKKTQKQKQQHLVEKQEETQTQTQQEKEQDRAAKSERSPSPGDLLTGSTFVEAISSTTHQSTTPSAPMSPGEAETLADLAARLYNGSATIDEVGETIIMMAPPLPANDPSPGGGGGQGDGVGPYTSAFYVLQFTM